jgi:gas vesicle protein
MLKMEGASNMEDDSKLPYFCLGLGLGVALGVLFAPKSGAETRQFLRDKAVEGKDYVKARADELKESAGAAIDRGKSAVQRQKDQLSAAMEAGKQAYREASASPKGD